MQRQTRNEQAQAEAALAGLEQRVASGWLSESETARQELETLGLQRGQVAMSFESCDGAAEAAGGRDRRAAAADRGAARARRLQSKRRGDQLRGEVATLNGRRSSLEALIREHSYSTDTVRNIFKRERTRQNTQWHGAGGNAGGLS